MESTFIAYYRVSTKQQGVSGLGLESQRQIVMSYIHHNGNKLLHEYTEVESGKNNDRPQLINAITMAKETGSILVIAKLDRLSRNLTFISQLLDSKVKFVCCDMPDANELTISIFASLAQWERKKISQRTKEALKIKRLRDPSWVPGTRANLTNDGRIKGHITIRSKARSNPSIRFAYHYIKSLREQGLTYIEIAQELNREGYLTREGKQFHAMQVWTILKRMEETK
jgi:DNA invertase Pin-like site-specific DNA recombinase